MFHSKRSLWLIVLSVIVSLAFVLAAYASNTPALRVMGDGLWHYRLDRNPSTGALKAKISVDFANPAVAVAYKQLNQRYATHLIADSLGQAQKVDVTLTFATPVSWEDVQKFPDSVIQAQ